MLSAEGLKVSNEDWVAIIILQFSIVATVNINFVMCRDSQGFIILYIQDYRYL